MFLLVAGTWGMSFMRLGGNIPFESLSIAPDGTPRLGPFEIKTAGKSQGEFLELAHRLVFDGSRYFSELYLPITTSHISQISQNLYEWQDLEGRIFLLNGYSFGDTARWSVSVINKTSMLVSKGGTKDQYIYDASGQLKDAYRYGVRRKYYYENGQLKQIIQDGTDGRSHFEFAHDQNGRLSALKFAGAQINFLRDHAGVLTGIKRNGDLDMTFNYKGGLLTAAVYDGRSFNWKWGKAQIRRGRPNVFLPPVVCSDGANNYSVLYDGNLIRGFWRQKNTSIGRNWDYLPITGGIKTRPF
jgi:hypothetical protein